MPTGSVPTDATQKPAEQVNPAAVPVPVHAVPIVGVTQLAPLQYSEPDTLPVPVHAPPTTAIPPPEVTQNPAEQVNPATVDVPTHAVATAGVIQLAPLQ
ncbi:MAG: hypothetical protein NT123_00275 [Proteobacteria bacterium]|nr:hypothetical protein [Pseudomonadota bacterium]